MVNPMPPSAEFSAEHEADLAARQLGWK